MARHRSVFDPDNPAPYELSRSKIELFVNCPACFWLEKVAGVKFPSIPGFLLNTNTDTLLKKDFDAYRGKGPHPLMAANGLAHLRPFDHEDLTKWTNSLHFGANDHYFNTVFEEHNLKLGGGVDDVWENIETGVLHIVDYKSTAQMSKTPKPLDESFIAPPQDETQKDYKASYRRQMDFYQWVLRRKGFKVSDTGYFVYVDGQHNDVPGMLDPGDPSKANMIFNVAIIPYQGDASWVEGTLHGLAQLLTKSTCPEHGEGCEFGSFITNVNQVTKST